MATSASRSRLFPARSRNSYRLEMEGRTLYLLLSLMALTGVVIFYLGVVTGKALRDPNATMTLATQAGAPAASAPETPAPKTLAFGEALKGDETAVEGLQKQGESATRRTEALLSQAKQQLRLEEVAPTRPEAPRTPQVPPQANAPAPSAPQVRAPMPQAMATAPQTAMPARADQPPANDAADDGMYTVQVFSSQHQENARQLMDRLRNLGFSAYLNRYEAADKQVWFRVRVGQLDRAGAEQLSERLRNEANLKNPQIQKL